MKVFCVSFLLLSVALAGCGQSDSTPEKPASLEGKWKTPCENGALKRIKFKGARYVFNDLKYPNADCTGIPAVTAYEDSKIEVTASRRSEFTHLVSFLDLARELHVSLLKDAMQFEGESEIYHRDLLALPSEPAKKN